MSNVDPGEPKYEDSDRITETSANGAGEEGSAVTFGANGDLVLTSGSNGFAGIQGSTPSAGGDSVPLQLQGIVPALVSPTVGTSVSKGEKLVPDANGELTNVDDGTGSAVEAGPGDIQAVSDSDSGVAEVLL